MNRWCLKNRIKWNIKGWKRNNEIEVIKDEVE